MPPCSAANCLFTDIELKMVYGSCVFGNPERTITTTGLSKWCGGGGWRFGAAFLYENIEPEFKQVLIGIGSETYSCAPAPVQMAAKVAYQNYDDTLEYLSKQTNILKQIGNYCSEQLNASKARVHAPEGGFYLFLDFSILQIFKFNLFIIVLFIIFSDIILFHCISKCT